MDKEKLDHFERILRSLAADLEAALATGRDVAAVGSDAGHGDLERVEELQSQEMSMAIRTAVSQRYEMVRRALDAIAKGAYGTCAGCQQPIPEARLQAIPETPFCVACSS